MLVIYKDVSGYKVTGIDNYNARIMDANKVIDCSGFGTPEQIIDYFCKYCGKSNNEFIVK